LFETGLRDPASFWENLARVGALMGDDRVGTPVMRDTHRPDGFILVKPADAVPAPGAPPIHAQRGLVLRRFRPAWSVQVALEDEKPVVLAGEAGGVIRQLSGPWRAEGEWWRTEAWTVETWQVELEDGAVYQLAHTRAGWWVEGVFD
jgi:protein ImuB